MKQIIADIDVINRTLFAKRKVFINFDFNHFFFCEMKKMECKIIETK